MLQAWVAIAPHSPAKGAEIDHYWSKFLTDIPFVLILALGIYLWRRPIDRSNRHGQSTASVREEFRHERCRL